MFVAPKNKTLTLKQEHKMKITGNCRHCHHEFTFDPQNEKFSFLGIFSGCFRKTLKRLKGGGFVEVKEPTCPNCGCIQ